MWFALTAAALLGCESPREQFISGRVADRCETNWPVCDGIAGCVLGAQSYVEGRFPAKMRVVVQIFEPSKVRLSFFLDEISAEGTETVLHFFEDRCRARIRETITGRSFIGDAQQQGFVYREVSLSGTGDHLVEFESDATARYLAKVDVSPTRLE